MKTPTANTVTFGQLPIGQAFDFISGTSHDSFFARCVKLSARLYTTVEGLSQSSDERTYYRIGSLSARVYHIGKST